ncbi:MAG: methionine adenosyltransferase [Thermoanaerobaculaceae bacterium]|nr:methionine adenosyltransferase [Thermoanaerobaculaceae bacterium]
MNKEYIFTSESVTEGHPDKIADQISDGVLDAVLAKDPNGHVACETLVTTGLVLVSGEITTTTYVDIPRIARGTLREIGYTKGDFGIDYKTCSVLTCIDPQSPDIKMGVDTGGAGDQGLMFGYACDETKELMPFPIFMAHRLTEKLSEVRKKGEIVWLRPDGKSQVSVKYIDGQPKEVTTVVLAAQHEPDVEEEELREELTEKVVKAVIPSEMLPKDVKIHINPTGRFVTGGPQGDTGLTGRKIIVDTYGGMGRHGGGAFSGKDPTKVDRSACYMARHIAKNIVAAKLAKKVEVQLAYVIGVADPVSIMVDTFGTGSVPEAKLEKAVRQIFALTPKGIIDYLKLKRPIFKKTAAYGHFGREIEEFTWEKVDRVNDLLEAVR